MSSIEVMGPLDMVRHLNSVAGELDIYAELEISSDDESRKLRLQNQIQALNQSHPLIGDGVRVYGQIITQTLGDDGESATAAIPYNFVEDEDAYLLAEREFMPDLLSEHQIAVTGAYKGYDCWRVYDPGSETSIHRVVHKIAGLAMEYTDSYGRDITEVHNSFVYAWGSDIFPIEPIMAHSLQDLQNDKIVRYAFDKIAFSEEYNSFDAIRKIGGLASKIFSRIDDDITMNHQRISYLNNLGLLDNTTVYAQDFMVGGSKEGFTSPEGDVIEFSDLFFVLNQGYRRTSNGTPYFPRGCQELFVKSWIEDDYFAMIPVSNILDIRAE